MVGEIHEILGNFNEFALGKLAFENNLKILNGSAER